MEQPLVSAITPCDREQDVINLVNNFIKQDYSNRKLVIVTCKDEVFYNHSIFQNDDIISCLHLGNKCNIGKMRNEAIDVSNGSIIVHMDSDDYYAPDWITRSVAALHNADVTGLNRAYFYREPTSAWYWDKSTGQPYVCEASMVFKRSVWERAKFPDIQSGEGAAFLANAGRIIPHDYVEGFIARIHGNNTASHKALHGMQPVSVDIVKNILNEFHR